MFKDFEKLCSPAKLYFAVAIITMIIGLFSGFHMMAIVGKLVFALLFTFLLNWLCSKGYKSLSWFLVLLPYVLLLMGMVCFFMLSKQQQHQLSHKN